MARNVVPEWSSEAVARLQGQVSALEFINETTRGQLFREQTRLAKLAVAATKCGIKLTEVFASKADVHHVRECMRLHLRKEHK